VRTKSKNSARLMSKNQGVCYLKLAIVKN
jgi:hypothetical protein